MPPDQCRPPPLPPRPPLPRPVPLDPFDRFLVPSAPPPALPPPPVPGQFSAPPFRGPSGWPPGRTFPEEWRQIRVQTVAEFVRGMLIYGAIVGAVLGIWWLVYSVAHQ